MDNSSFVFHDATGRRWSRVKRVAFAAAATLLVLGGGVAIAVTQIAPGRAPSLFSATAPEQLHNWPVRDSGGASTITPSVAQPTPAANQPAASRSSPAGSPAATARPSPAATSRPKPRRTRPPG